MLRGVDRRATGYAGSIGFGAGCGREHKHINRRKDI